jgi:predicted amidophosphoribosyltransferase
MTIVFGPRCWRCKRRPVQEANGLCRRCWLLLA